MGSELHRRWWKQCGQVYLVERTSYIPTVNWSACSIIGQARYAGWHVLNWVSCLLGVFLTWNISSGIVIKLLWGFVSFLSLELFPSPVLMVSPSQPIEGSLVTLTCQTQVSPQRPDVQLQFHFFKDSRALGSGWSSSSDLQIPIMWSEDSGSYCCQAQAVPHGISKWSAQVQIHVQSKYLQD